MYDISLRQAAKLEAKFEDIIFNHLAEMVFSQNIR